MNKVTAIILIGIPASGKSTWARKYAEKHPEFVIISRDLFRRDLGVEVGIPDTEKRVRSLEDVSINENLTAGHSIIIDDTNLIRVTVERIKADIKRARPDCIIKIKFFPCSLRKALKRNSKRTENQVPEEIMKDMYTKLRADIIFYWRQVIFGRK